MQKYIIDHITRVYYIKLAALAFQLRDDYNKKTTHHFRTDTKKLRAFYRLISLEAGQARKLKLPGKLHKMYHHAGAVRDLQVQIKNVEDYFQKTGIKLHTLQAMLELRLKRLSEKKGQILPGEYFADQEKRAQLKSPPQLHAETLQQFFRQKKEAISSIITKARFNATDLHNIRKNIKDILYVTGIYTEDIGSSLPMLFRKNNEMKEMEDLADELGRYNDTGSTLSFLKRNRRAFKGREKQSTLFYSNKLEQEQKDRRNTLVARFKSMTATSSPGPHHLDGAVNDQ